jgi:hypothetical protein
MELIPGTDPHKALRDDVRLLGELFGETLRNRAGERPDRGGARDGEARACR